MRLVLVLSALFLLASNPLWAQDATPEPQEEPASPILALEEGYQVFPAERLANSLYRNGERIFSRQGLAVRGMLVIKQGLLVYATDEDNQKKLELIPGEEMDVSLEALEDGFYRLKVKGGLSRLFRILEDGEIQDLLPRSNTAGNFVFNGKDKGAFTHIVGGKQVETSDGRTRYQYSFKLHVVEQGKNEVTHLAPTVVNYSADLNLRWIRENQLQYTDGNGQVERITVR
ncbi:MAG: hypothetical protein RRB13_06240 [bacterium]|nr:hypothetical protein [bacterium]